MEMLRFKPWNFQLKTVVQFFEKSFRFSEHSFKSESIENGQNFQLLSHKNMPISQTDGNFKNS